MRAVTRDDITGLLLAGGQGVRMDGADKGLQTLRGAPLASLALARLSPQVGGLMISANRHLAEYQAFGPPVYRDDPSDAGCGPLAGTLAGLRHCPTPYLLTVPCDTPGFPVDLAERLAHAMTASGADIAIAGTRPPSAAAKEVRRQPVFCLMRTHGLADDLSRFLRAGERKMGLWASRHRCAVAVFDDDAAFMNINTAEELAALQ